MDTILLVHVVISLVGIASGLVVAWGLLDARPVPGWTALFLGTTIATSVTGFALPADRLLPSHIFGVLSLVALAIAVFALYARRLAGPWRVAYIVSSLVALYLNMFVGVVQAFQKVPALNALAPTQSELPFAAAQVGLLALMVVLGRLATVRARTAS